MEALGSRPASYGDQISNICMGVGRFVQSPAGSTVVKVTMFMTLTVLLPTVSAIPTDGRSVLETTTQKVAALEGAVEVLQGQVAHLLDIIRTCMPNLNATCPLSN